MKFTPFALLLLLCLNSNAQRQVKIDSASFKPLIEYYIKGNSKVIGNSILGHHKTKPFMVSDKINDEIKMVYVDVDDDPSTFSSSQSKLSLPNQNCKIVFAGLYWSATYKTVKGIKEQKGNHYYYKGKGKRDENFNLIKFKTPNSNYQDITGQVLFDKGASEDFKDNKPYVCYKDVTQLVNTSTEKSGFYTIANVKATQGYISGGSSAGWMLYVIYETIDESPKYITAYNGFSYVNENVVDIKFKNFHSLDSDKTQTSLIFAALEGDSKIKQDQCTIIKADGSSFVPLNNSVRPARNFFNSKITSAKGIERIPNSSNTLGFDIAELELEDRNNEIINGNTKETTLRLKTRKDRFYLFFTAFQTEISQSFYDDKKEKNIVITDDISTIKKESRETVLRKRKTALNKRKEVYASRKEDSKLKKATQKRNNSRTVKRDDVTRKEGNSEKKVVSNRRGKKRIETKSKDSQNGKNNTTEVITGSNTAKNEVVNRENESLNSENSKDVVLNKTNETIANESVESKIDQAENITIDKASEKELVLTDNQQNEVNQVETLAQKNKSKAEVSREKERLESSENTIVQKEETRASKRNKKLLARSKKRQARKLNSENSKGVVINKTNETIANENNKYKIEQAENTTIGEASEKELTLNDSQQNEVNQAQALAQKNKLEAEVSREKERLESSENTIVQKEETRASKRNKKLLARSKKRQARKLNSENSKGVVINKTNETIANERVESKIEQAENTTIEEASEKELVLTDNQQNEVNQAQALAQKNKSEAEVSREKERLESSDDATVEKETTRASKRNKKLLTRSKKRQARKLNSENSKDVVLNKTNGTIANENNESKIEQAENTTIGETSEKASVLTDNQQNEVNQEEVLAQKNKLEAEVSREKERLESSKNATVQKEETRASKRNKKLLARSKKRQARKLNSENSKGVVINKTNGTLANESVESKIEQAENIIVDEASEKEIVLTDNQQNEVNQEQALAQKNKLEAEVSREKERLESSKNAAVQKEETTRASKRNKKLLARSKKRQARNLNSENSKGVVLNKTNGTITNESVESKIEQAENKTIGEASENELVLTDNQQNEVNQEQALAQKNKLEAEVSREKERLESSENTIVQKELIQNNKDRLENRKVEKGIVEKRKIVGSIKDRSKESISNKTENIKHSKREQKPVNPIKTYAEIELEKLEKKKGTLMSNMDAGYYVVTNVFSQPKLSSKWQSKLISEGYKPNVIINPKNNWHYVYLLKTQNPQEAINKKNALRRLPIFEEAWVFKINL